MVTKSSQGKWEDGTYKMLDKTYPKTRSTTEKFKGSTIKQDSQNGRYGTGGIYRAYNFYQTDGLTRTGMGIHAGRQYKPFIKRITNGCIRTTPACITAIGAAVKMYGPLTEVTVMNNKPTTSRTPVTPSTTITPEPITPLAPVPLPVLPGATPINPSPSPSPDPRPFKPVPPPKEF